MVCTFSRKRVDRRVRGSMLLGNASDLLQRHRRSNKTDSRSVREAYEFVDRAQLIFGKLAFRESTHEAVVEIRLVWLGRPRRRPCALNRHVSHRSILSARDHGAAGLRPELHTQCDDARRTKAPRGASAIETRRRSRYAR
jgi:hypothetical protein